ncbi:MAG: hypothetical protein ACFE9S_14515 [Candidatus Hermodarchaeota archaeon]
MRVIEETQYKKIKEFIFRNGRLLERKLFSYFFESGNKDDVIKALVAYQNLDGGFGNGIEPDLLCPNSTAIGAETAMFLFDLLEDVDNEIIERLINWVIVEQNEEGYINHPPKDLYNYPFQKWWDGPDEIRILAISGLLKKWGFKDTNFYEKVKRFYSTCTLPKEYQLYEYPYFIYLKYLGENNEEKHTLQQIINQLPSLFEKNKEHYLLFGRHWYHALDIVDKKIINNEADIFFNGLQDDGGLKIVYQDLPHWRPIWTLDALILLKKSSMVELLV